MTNMILRLLLVGLTLAVAAGGANAHPHVWVSIKSELVYAADGSATGVRHHWAFDDMFSTFATQGLESKVKGQFTREELAPLAEVNITSLKEFDYFTHAKANGKKAEFNPPTDYFLDFTNNVLTLHFTLPFKAPAKAQSLDIEVFDGTYFVDFVFLEKDPVTLVNAPASCKLDVVRPFDKNPAPGKPLSESFFSQLGPNPNFGAQYSAKLSVKCS